jgi:lantibiotic modifying enzyme
VAEAGEAGGYYRRAGKLLCLLHLLGATDCHAGNVIACGERPVPVDLETLLQPRPVPSANDLLLVGILPFWKRGLDGKSYDVGALTGSTGREPSFRVWRCRAINSDAMELDIAYETVPTGTNVVVRDGAPVAAADQVEDVVTGFTETWRFLIARREGLLAADGPLIPFGALSVRTILRPTLVYARYCHEALDPELLVDDGAHATALERIRSEALGEGSPVEGIELEGVLQAERDAMARMDVPLFHVPSDTGYRIMLERLEGFDESGLEEAVGIIRATLGLSKLAALL